MILATKSLGMDRETIQRLEREMLSQMDMKTEEEVEKEYRSFV